MESETESQLKERPVEYKSEEASNVPHQKVKDEENKPVRKKEKIIIK